MRTVTTFSPSLNKESGEEEVCILAGNTAVNCQSVSCPGNDVKSCVPGAFEATSGTAGTNCTARLEDTSGSLLAVLLITQPAGVATLGNIAQARRIEGNDTPLLAVGKCNLTLTGWAE